MQALPDEAAPPEIETPAAGPFRLVLVDGSGFIFRAFHALPSMTRPDGTPVNAVFGFTNMLARLLKDHTGTHLAVIFDAGRTTHRTRLFENYKANRPEPPDELKPQFALVRDATKAFGVPAIELQDWEADDLIATYTRAAVEAGGEVVIVSSDKDMMQLIRPGVIMQDPIKQKPIGAAEVMEKFGVAPDKVPEVQALIGDSVDNVPGVPSIGPKKAAALIQEYGTVDAVLAAIPSMKPSKQRDALETHQDAARMSRQLVQLTDCCDMPVPIDALHVREPDPATLGPWLAMMGFRTTAQRLGLADAQPAMPTAPVMRQAGLASAAEAPPIAPPQLPFENYACITDEDALAAWIAEARQAGVVALDTETSGLDPLRAELVGISLAVAPGRACYVPLRHGVKPEAQLALDAQADVPKQVDLQTACRLFGPLLTDPAVMKVFHNGKFDLLVLQNASFCADLAHCAPIDDTMLISYALDAGAHGHGMDELSLLHLGHRPISYDSVTGTGRARVPFGQVALDRATAYAAEDADVTLRLWHALRPRLREAGALAAYEQVDRRLLRVIAGMEREGVKVDAAELRRMSASFADRMAVMETDIHQLAGRPFQLGSAKQLGEVLFDEQGLPGGKRLPGGTWGTDAAVLQKLAEAGHALPARILEWRQLAKLKSTYADSLVQQADPGTHRVHTSFSLAQTSTGRLSSTDPNLQNIPIRTEEGARIRRAFVAEPGNDLISCDYSQIELRLLAHVADIPALKESFVNGEDIHARTAREVFGEPAPGQESEYRRRAKTINFGIIYGISAFGLAERLGIGAGEARAYIDAYFARYPEIRDYMERTKEEAREHGYVLTPFGRRCWVPQIQDKKQSVRAYAERAAINAPLQGGAADIIKRAMVRLPSAIAEAGLQARLLLQVHDELLFEAPTAQAAQTAALAKRIMEEAATLSIPLLVETGTGRSWAEAH